MNADKSVVHQTKICRGLPRVTRLAPPVISAIIACGTASWARAAPIYTVIYTFSGRSDGGNARGPFIINEGTSGAAQALYGTTPGGGTGPCTNGCGEAFQLTPPATRQGAWTKTALYNFTNGADGNSPSALSAETTKVTGTSMLYGTTGGGASGNGTVFQLASGNLTTLYTFKGGRDGTLPNAGVVANAAGALFATTFEGGTNGCGTAIKLTPPSASSADWKESTIWTFVGGPYGCNPNGIIIDSTGALEGTSNEFYGNAFKLIPPKPGRIYWNDQPLASFDGTDGAYTYTSLSAGKNGVLYGTTYTGGTANDGVVYELLPPTGGKKKWQLHVLWNFQGGSTGAAPLGPPIVDANGAIYGTTEGGGPTNNGIVYKLAPPAGGKGAWVETILYYFSGGADGGYPTGALSADSAGTLYGTTSFGGLTGDGCLISCGVAFSITGAGYAP